MLQGTAVVPVYSSLFGTNTGEDLSDTAKASIFSAVIIWKYFLLSDIAGGDACWNSTWTDLPVLLQQMRLQSRKASEIFYRLFPQASAAP